MTKAQSSTPHMSDPRWRVFDLVQRAREPLGLKARSLTVLRGLLSFITAEKWFAGDLHVFPSNRILQERCDAMDERTLRRHLAQLCSAGLISRNMSPNRKRYQVRDEEGVPVVCYGFDLSALKLGMERLEALADAQAKLTLKIKALKAVLRDLLWKAQVENATFFKLLRNKSSAEELEAAVAKLRETVKLTDSDGQFDRDIQNSDKEYLEEDNVLTTMNYDLSLSECVEAAKSAIELSPVPINTWEDLSELADSLAPCLGIHDNVQRAARSDLGALGYTLTILGLVQSYGRIKNIHSYLGTLRRKAISGKLNLKRMYHSLTSRSWFPAGNRLAVCSG